MKITVEHIHTEDDTIWLTRSLVPPVGKVLRQLGLPLFLTLQTKGEVYTTSKTRENTLLRIRLV